MFSFLVRVCNFCQHNFALIVRSCNLYTTFFAPESLGLATHKKKLCQHDGYIDNYKLKGKGIETMDVDFLALHFKDDTATCF